MARVTTRQWRHYVRRQDWESPIIKGPRFLQVFEQPAVTTYAEAASILGVSRQRVYQLASLVRKLPDEEKLAGFAAMLGQANGAGRPPRTAGQ